MNTKSPVTWLASLFAFFAADNPLLAQSVAPGRAVEPVVELSPFVVNSSKDTGYQAMSTLAGTRLDVPLKDLGAAISIYTKDFIEDIGATNVNELLIYATGMEAAGPGGNFSYSVPGGQNLTATNGTNDALVRADLQNSTRSRGLVTPTITRNFFATQISMDSYNTDRVTVLRGPNAALFGVSSPSGVTDTSLVQADLHRSINKVSFRLDNNGGTRSTVDFNRVLIPDKLAARLAGLQMREEFNQRPAFDSRKRIYGTITYAPFKDTSLRVNFESGRHVRLTPYTITPTFDLVPDWNNNGRPGYDWTFYDDPNRNPLAASQNAGNFVPQYMNQFNLRNIARFYANPDDKVQSFAIQGTIPNTAASIANAVKNQLFHPLLNRDLAADTQVFTTTLGIASIPASSYWTGGNVLPNQQPGQSIPGLKPQNFTDFSAFDWKNRLIDETPRFYENFHASNWVIEQTAWQKRVGISLTFDRQRDDHRSRVNYFHASQNESRVYIDTTVTLPNGLPNPNLGRPFVSSQDTFIFYNAFINQESRRFSSYLKYDFKDLNDSWGTWLGRHTLSFVADRYRIDSVSWRPNDMPDGPFEQQLAPFLNTRTMATVVYLGPSLIGNNNPVKLNPVRTGLTPFGPLGTVSSFVRAANDTDLGSFQDSPLSGIEIVTNSSGNREVIKSRAVTLQSNWLQDHVATVFGWRRDEDFAQGQPLNYVQNPANPNNPGKILWGFDDIGHELPFANTPPPISSGEVKSYSVVLRWPQKLIKLPRGVDFSVFYNNSQNFTPTSNNLTLWGGPGRPPPRGKTKEYGFNFSAFNDKLTIRVNHYENVSANISGNFTAAGAIANLPLDAVIRWSTEANVNPQLQAMRNADIALLKSVLPANYFDLFHVKINGVAPNLAGTRDGSIFGASDITDVAGKGNEIDIIYNPTARWRILANVSHTEVRRTNITPYGKIMMGWMDPVIKQLAGRANGTYPVGWQIGDPLPANIETFGAFVDRTIRLPMAIDALIEGDPTAEVRPWRANLVTNYSLGNDPIFGEKLKGWSLGGGLRWQDKAITGYPSGRMADVNFTPTLDKAHAWHSPTELNIDVFCGYTRKIWNNRIDWKAQLNVTNIFEKHDLIPLQAQPWGQAASVRLAPERRWYLTNAFSF